MLQRILSALILGAALVSPTIAVAASPCADIARTLRIGSSGEDVRLLQQALNADPRTQVAKTGPGSPGSETTYFGPATHRAVMKYQEMYRSAVLAPAGLSLGTGVVGPLTRAHLRQSCSGARATPDTGISAPAAPVSPSTQARDSAPSLPRPTGIVSAANLDVPESSVAKPGVFVPTKVTTPWLGDFQFSKLFVLMTGETVMNPGGKLRIFGTGFTADTPNTIHIGDRYTIENVGVDQSGLINVTLPADVPKGRHYIWVSNANGVSNKDVFIVVPTPGIPGPKIILSSPERGKAGETVTVYGSGFSKTWNDIHFPTAIISNVKSPDGKTLVFTIPPADLGLTADDLQYAPDIVSTFYVINDYGVSDGLPFTVQFK